MHLLHHTSYQAGRRRSYGLLPGFQSAAQSNSQDGLQWNDVSCAPPSSPSSPPPSSSSSPLSPPPHTHTQTLSPSDSEWLRSPDGISSTNAAPGIEHSTNVKGKSTSKNKSRTLRPVTLPPAGRGQHLKTRSSRCSGLREKTVIVLDEGASARVLLGPGQGARRRTYGFLPALASSSTLPVCSTVSYCEAAMRMAPQYPRMSGCEGVGDHGAILRVTGESKIFMCQVPCPCPCPSSWNLVPSSGFIKHTIQLVHQISTITHTPYSPQIVDANDKDKAKAKENAKGSVILSSNSKSKDKTYTSRPSGALLRFNCEV